MNGNFSHVIQVEAKNIFSGPYLSPPRGNEARGGVPELDEPVVTEWSRCGGRCWRWRATCGCLDCNHHWRTCFEETDRGIGSVRRLIGIEPEVVECAPTNRVRVLVLANVSVFQVIESEA